MIIEIGQVFVIDYLCKDGKTVHSQYHISNGKVWDNMECTSEIIVNNKTESDCNIAVAFMLQIFNPTLSWTKDCTFKLMRHCFGG